MPLRILGSTWNKRLTQYSTPLILAGLATVVFSFYHPILQGYFLSDDNFFLFRLLENAQSYLHGERLEAWFFSFNGATFLRPMVQWLFLFNLMAWNTNAAGYYFTNIILHVLNVSLVYLLTWQITRNRMGAVAAGLFFALHPIHADSVSWIVDCVDLLGALFCLFSALFYVLFRQRSRRLYGGIALLSFALASLSKESTLALPVVLLAYDIVCHFRILRWNILRAQFLLWLMVPGYVALRFLLFGRFGGFDQMGYMSFGWELFLHYNVLALLKPFVPDMSHDQLVVGLVLFGLFIVYFRNVKGLWFGVVWIVSFWIPAGTANYVAPRLVYLPSVGWAIVQGAMVAWLASHRTTRMRGLALGLVSVLVIGYGYALALRVDDWATVGNVARIIPEETRRLYPAFPPNSKVYFIGIPVYLRGIDIYTGTFPAAMAVAYHNTPSFTVDYGDQFPIVAERLDQSFFFEYRKRKVIERSDVRQILLERRQCLDSASLKLTWDFALDSQDWESWNQLSEFAIREGTWTMRSEGNDPIMASPPISIPTLAIGDIEITMRVQAVTPTLSGEVYWLVAGQQDFSPLARVPFKVQADGEFHTYRVNLAASETLPMDLEIVRLRLDPVNAPAQIAVRKIQIYSYCQRLENSQCFCK